MDSLGNIEWQRCLGGTQNDGAYYIDLTSDGGYILAGFTCSNNDDVSGWHTGYDYYGVPESDFWVVKLNASGEISWQKCLGGSQDDIAFEIHQTNDGGYIVAGYTYSEDGDVFTGRHEPWIADYWVVKLSSTGNIIWERCLGGNDDDWAYSVKQTLDGGYIVAVDGLYHMMVMSPVTMVRGTALIIGLQNWIQWARLCGRGLLVVANTTVGILWI